MISDRAHALQPDPAILSPAELKRVTAYKVQYHLETLGFSAQEARRIQFLQWRIRTGRLAHAS